jgi:hypothetical protein
MWSHTMRRLVLAAALTATLMPCLATAATENVVVIIGEKTGVRCLPLVSLESPLAAVVSGVTERIRL